MNNLPLHKLSLTELEELFSEIFDNYLDYELVKRAYDFAKKAHAGQLRDEGREYIVHPLRMIITMFRDYQVDDRNMLVAALLHDVIEDTSISAEQIREEFGEKACDYVLALTRPRDANENPNDKFAAKKRKFEYYMQAPFKVKQIKLFDLIDNMLDWQYFPKNHPTTEKFPRWLFEYKHFVVPLAESVGPRYLEPISEVLSKMKKMGYEPKNGSYKA